MNETTAQVLVQNGIMNIIDLSAAEADLVARVTGRTSIDAKGIIAIAAAALENPDIKPDIVMEGEIVSASAVPQLNSLVRKDNRPAVNKDGTPATPNKFSEAEARLREELAAFKLK
jgi:N utilization substance protein A